MSDSRSWVGRLFHTRGPAAANERSPRRVLVRCTRHVSMSDERSCWRPVTDTSWQSSARYTGRSSRSALYTSTAILNCTRWRTGSQCSCCRTGVMCSHVLVLVMRRAAAFWTACYRRRYRWGRRWLRTVVSCNSPGILKWTPGLATVRHNYRTRCDFHWCSN